MELVDAFCPQEQRRRCARTSLICRTMSSWRPMESLQSWWKFRSPPYCFVGSEEHSISRVCCRDGELRGASVEDTPQLMQETKCRLKESSLPTVHACRISAVPHMGLGAGKGNVRLVLALVGCLVLDDRDARPRVHVGGGPYTGPPYCNVT